MIEYLERKLNEARQVIGDSHPKATLTDYEVELMRELREDHNWTYDQLVLKFEVPKGTVAKICRYERRNQTVFAVRKIAVG